MDLVLHAFENANQGDIFVQKAPAATILDLANSLKDIFKSNSPIEIIGTRHGEKLYESLVSREEMAHAKDMNNYFRLPADGRDLNYSTYFNVGELAISNAEDFTSHNTKRLTQEETKKLLLGLRYIQNELSI